MTNTVVGSWPTTRLGDITTKIGSGATPRGGKGAYKEAGISLIRSLNVYDFHFDYKDLAFLDSEQAARLSNVEVQPQDILLNITGASVARCCMVPKQVLPARVNQHVAIVRINRKICDPAFVFYCINSPDYKHHLLTLAQGGATREALTKQTIADFRVPVPPLPTQRKIASVLSVYDDLIENNTRRIEILEEMAQKIYREWFVNFRFPGHDKVGMVDSELGQIPEGWERVGSHELLKSSLGGDWGKESLTVKETCPVAVIRGTDFGDVRYGKALRVPTRYISETSLTKRRLHPGDIIVENSVNAQSRSVGSTRLITQELLNRISADTIAASFCKVFRPRDPEIASLMQLHLAYLYSEDRILFYQNVAANGIGNFQAKRFIESECMSLPTDNQSRAQMARFFADLHKFASNLAHRIYVLRLTRDLLLPKLISGEVDVDEAGIQSELDEVTTSS